MIAQSIKRFYMKKGNLMRLPFFNIVFLLAIILFWGHFVFVEEGMF